MEVAVRRATVLDSLVVLGPHSWIGLELLTERASRAVIMNRFIYSQITTWPTKVVRLLQQHSQTLSLHARVEEELDLAGSIARHESINPHDDVFERVCNDLDQQVASDELIGWHYARLAEDEIEDMRRNGIEVSSAEFAEARIQRRARCGDISPEGAEKLLAANLYTNGSGRRAGMFWLVFDEELATESGIEIFLRYWGGEAISRPHVGTDLDSALRFGTPCVVEIAAPVNALTYPDLGRRMVERWVAEVIGEETVGMESNLKTALGSEHVLRVIRMGDPDFERLTGVGSWSEPLM